MGATEKLAFRRIKKLQLIVFMRIKKISISTPAAGYLLFAWHHFLWHHFLFRQVKPLSLPAAFYHPQQSIRLVEEAKFSPGFQMSLLMVVYLQPES